MGQLKAIMRSLLFAVLVLVNAAFARAEAKLECINLSRIGVGGPFLMAQISGLKVLDAASLDRHDPVLLPYSSEDGFEPVTLARVEGRLISTQGHPFAGNQDFLLRFGEKMARLILPAELEAQAMESSRLGGVAPPDANGMIILETTRHHDHAQPDTVVWLNCRAI